MTGPAKDPYKDICLQKSRDVGTGRVERSLNLKEVLQSSLLEVLLKGWIQADIMVSCCDGSASNSSDGQFL